MDDTTKYGQMDFTLPHDVVPLPSEGKFYKHGKKSFKVGYLTADDENVLVSQTKGDGIINALLRNKIYEPDVNISELLEGDIEAILIFLRNTSFGPDYNFRLKDPKTGKDFEHTIKLDELDIIKPKIQPNKNGLFEFNLPKTGVNVICKLLSSSEVEEISKIADQYPAGTVAPIVTKTLEKHIISIDGDENRENVTKFVRTLPIMDSKFIRNTMRDCEPRLDLNRVISAPSGEKMTLRISFGAEFFRPFF